MTEILSKEKEYLKLNEQLDRMAAATAMENHSSQTRSEIATPMPDRMSNTNTDNRFLTFQKVKGQSTLLKKRGAGDGLSGMVEITTTTTRATLKERLTTTSHNTNTIVRGDTYRHANRHPEILTSPRQSIAGATPTPSSSMGHSTKLNCGTVTRKPAAKGNETFRSQTQTQTRTSNSRVPPTNTSTFTIKYRNPKFVESPSLEIMVKDECSTTKSQKPSIESTRLENVASMSREDVNSTGRRSQMSNIPTGPRKNVSTDGLIKFLKSKISILEEDHARISQEMTKQRELLEKSLERSKLLEQQRDLATSKQNGLKDQLTKVEAQLDEASQLNKDRSKEQLQQQKELETARREMKIMNQNNNNLEKRLNRANEELESARKTVTEMKSAEKDLKERARLDCEAKEKQIKNLKKQRADLLNAYKKQLFLIDNLKRQTVCLEQSKMIAFGEKEFSKVLEWDMKS